MNPEPFWVYYIGRAKLIFSFNEEKQGYSYYTEEDLEERVRKMKDFIVKLEYIQANSNNDAAGNQI